MRVDATVDDREPAGVVEAVREHPDVTGTGVRRLASGDIVLRPEATDGGRKRTGNGNGEPPTTAVERKTPRDFVQSAVGRHGSDLRDQLARLAAGADHAYLLVEGDVADVERATGLDGAAVTGTVASLMARSGVPVVFCGSRDRLVDLAVRLARKHAEAPGRRALPSGAVPSRAEPTAKRMYGTVDGIGPALATTLHEAYPTVESLLGASVEDLTELEGFGEGRARAVYEALRTPE
ncbi:ERCC4 domain-containing protein [Halomarina litorea]|uniref:ERCC4 domain-containing protein n=1 Tax=Halomarina litorea TaxID=2961595 RepID=UPI0020C4159D|nr:ERCC4 domain-containing protein [Halomarina sp. BCD28]